MAERTQNEKEDFAIIGQINGWFMDRNHRSTHLCDFHTNIRRKKFNGNNGDFQCLIFSSWSRKMFRQYTRQYINGKKKVYII